MSSPFTPFSLGLLLSCSLLAEPTAPARDYHLFVGVDLFVEREGEIAAVVGFVDDRTLVRDEAGQTTMMARNDGFRVRLDPKVSGVSVTLSELQVKETSSAVETAKREAVASQIGLLNLMSDRAHAATVRYAAPADLPGAPPPTQLGSKNAGAYYEPQPEGGPQYSSEELAADFQTAQVALDQVLTDSVRYVTGKDGKTEGDADGLWLIITASSPIELPEAQAVVLSRIRDAGGKLIDFSYARPLGRIGPQPRRHVLEIRGLPPGFTHLESQVHVFNHGVEVATNRAEKRLALTGDEARDYVRLDHLGRHREASAPAAVAWSLAPPALQAVTSRAEVDFATEVALDEKGDVVRIGRPEDVRVMPPLVRQILATLVYLPAVDHGVGQAAVLPVNLADFVVQP